MTEEVHLTEHQNDLIIFSLVYVWANMIKEGRFNIGKGEYRFTIQEIEELLLSMDIDHETLVEYKDRILRDEV